MRKALLTAFRVEVEAENIKQHYHPSSPPRPPYIILYDI